MREVSILLSLVLLFSFTSVSAEVEISSEADYVRITNDTWKFKEFGDVSDLGRVWVANSEYAEVVPLLPIKSQNAIFTIVGDQSKTCLNLLAIEEGEEIDPLDFDRYTGCVDVNVDTDAVDQEILAGINSIHEELENNKTDTFVNGLLLGALFLIPAVLISFLISRYFYKKSSNQKLLEK